MVENLFKIFWSTLCLRLTFENSSPALLKFLFKKRANYAKLTFLNTIFFYLFLGKILVKFVKNAREN